MSSSREEWLESLLEAHQICFWEYDISGDRLIWSDSCASLWATTPDRLAQTYEQLCQQIRPRDRADFHRLWQQAIAQQNPYALQFRPLLPEDKEVCFEQRGQWIESQGAAGARLIGQLQAIASRPEPEPQPAPPDLDCSDRQALEQQLLEQQQLLNSFISGAPVGIAILDSQLRYRHINQTLAAINGFPVAAHLGKTIREMVPPPVAREIERICKQILTTNNPVLGIEVTGERADAPGELGTQLVSYFPLRGSAETAPLIGIITYGISDRVAAEAALAASEARFRAFVEALPDTIFRLNRQSIFTDFIAPPSTPLLLAPEDFIGRFAGDVLPDSLVRQTLTYVERVLQTGQLHSVEYQLPLGEELNDFEARYAPCGEDEVVAIVRNISDRKRAERERSRLNAILESTSDFVGTWDLQGRITYLNQAGRAMLGIAAEENPMGAPVASCHPAWVVRLLQEEAIAIALREGVWQGESAVLHRDGREIPVSQVIIAHKNADGTLESLSSILRDISHLKATEAQLKQKARLAAFRADVDAALTQEDRLDRILTRCTEAVIGHLEAAFARIWIRDRATNTLILQASSGLYTHLDGPRSRIPLDGGSKIAQIAARGEPHLTNTASEDPFIDGQWARAQGIVAFAGYPLNVDGSTIGVIALFARTVLPATTLQALEIASSEIALGIRRQQANKICASARYNSNKPWTSFKRLKRN